jgi:uncharacterized membrane protein
MDNGLPGVDGMADNARATVTGPRVPTVDSLSGPMFANVTNGLPFRYSTHSPAAQAHRVQGAFMQQNYDDVARRLLGQPYEALDEPAQNVARHIARRTHIARDVSVEGERSSFGQRAADRVARFGGSWAFILSFIFFILAWVLLNSWLLLRLGTPFDPYPYILLNLFLSMLASVQAPLILMSQNRQTEKDRLDAANDYQVNLKAELEIMLLHEKLDALRDRQWSELVAMQAQQIELLERLLAQRDGATPPVAPS